MSMGIFDPQGERLHHQSISGAGKALRLGIAAQRIKIMYICF